MFNWNIKESPILSLLGMGGGAGGNLAGGAAVASVIASGGAVHEYTDGSTTYRVHIFANSVADFVYTSGPGSIDVMVMGGGGSGSTSTGDQDAGKGGGGSGGLAWASAIPVSPGTTCPVTVGAGGQGHYGADSTSTRVGRNGGDSQFVIPSGPHTIIGRGGGGGGVSDSGPNSVAATRVPNTNTNNGMDGGSGGGSGGKGSGNSQYNGGSTTQAAANPSMPWVTDYGNDGGDSESSPSGSGGGGGGIGGAGGNSASPGPSGGVGGAGKSDFVGPAASQKAFFLGTKGLGMDDSNPHAYATPSAPAVYFGGGGSGAPGTSGGDVPPVAYGLGGLGGGGRAGLGRNVQQSGPLSSTLPSAYWHQIGGANHHGGGGGGAGDDPMGPGSKRSSGGFAGRGGQGVVVVRYEYTAGTNTTFVAATGGTTSTDGDYKIHKFDGSGTSNSPNTFTVTQKAGDPKDNTIEVLVVGGGGSGGKWSGGGGGAGGVAHTYNYTLDHPAFPGSGPWAIPLQSGGGGSAQTSNGTGNVGGDSFFGPTSLRVYALGGGGGGTSRDQPDRPATTFQSMDGGSGGGGTGQDRNIRAGFGHQRDIFGSSPQTTLYSNKLEYNEKTVIYNYGHSGGQSPSDSSADMGGGGGAGGVGANGGPGSGYSAGNGHGGPGVTISITGSGVIYAGGGTAASPPGSEPGAPGGGGSGAGGSGTGGAGTDGLGGGGGGAYSGGPGSGRGGAGTVIVRYKYQ